MKFDLALGLCYRFRAPVKKAQNRVNQISDLTSWFITEVSNKLGHGNYRRVLKLDNDSLEKMDN